MQSASKHPKVPEGVSERRNEAYSEMKITTIMTFPVRIAIRPEIVIRSALG